MKPHTPLLALAVALCLGSVLANDLQVAVKVYGCKGELLRGVTVRISGCVDDGLTGRSSVGITTTTNSDGIAFFKERAENSIQYCWGSATNKCKIQVVGGAGSATYATLGLLDSRRQLVSPRDWLCSEKKCCKPCAPNNAQEASCTQFIDYGLLEFRPTGGCPRSCCADECTARVRVNGRDTTATGTCSGHFDELRGSRRRSLLQAADDGTTSVTAEVLAEVPADVVFLNDDGTVLKMGNATTTAGRRLMSGHDGDGCPEGWVNSGRDCAVGGCGTCCIRMRS